MDMKTVALSFLLGAVVLALGIGVGFGIGYTLKDCDDDNDDVDVDAPDVDVDVAVSVARPIFNHAPGLCYPVKGTEFGSEDIQLLPSGLALISSGLQILKPITPETWQKGLGKMKTFDFSKPEEGATDLTIIPTDDLNLDNLNPHGFSVYPVEETGEVYVFVINHGYAPAMKESVEKFQLDEEARTLTHLRTIMDDEHFYMLNDLVATGPDSFYYTNWLSTRDFSKQVAEMRSGESKASVGYYDGQEGRLVLERQHESNGINVSPDGKYVYVAHNNMHSVGIYQRESDNELVLSEDYFLGTGVDNIDVAGDYLWIGGIPMALTPEDIENGMKYSAQVIRMKVEDGKGVEAIEVYANDGSSFARSSTAVTNNNGGMLVGTRETEALYCELTYVG